MYKRSDGVWTQRAKLVGTGAIGKPGQGWSVSLSGSGNTAIVGGYFDNDDTGAAWVHRRSGPVWKQQAKLIAAGSFTLGLSVSLSGDGNTAIVGGPTDNDVAGAVWVFKRSGGVWTQQGPKLVGTGAIGIALQGNSVALSRKGRTAIVGGPADNGGVGAAWVYTQTIFAGTPGKSNCYGQSVSALAQQFGGLNAAAAGTGFPSISALQNAILAYCDGSDQVASTLR